jgi:glycosyltransferase involved in cell wall biosynthesis
MSRVGARYPAPRVIHIVESLDVGAVEGWLFRMLKTGKKFGADLDWTFYSVLQRPGRFDQAAREMGARVVNSPVALDEKYSFVRALRKELQRGRYDVLHCHHDVVSAVYLTAAIGLSISRRIVHVHNADLHVPTGSPRKSAFLREPMRRLCLRFADRIVGISNYTLDNFLSNRPRKLHRDVVLYYGIDTESYRAPPPCREALRRSLGLPNDASILLFAGRMVDYKNPLFLIDVLDEIAEEEPNACAVFAGAGPLEEQVRDLAKWRGVEDRVRVLGWRDDTVALMQGADLFVFPRVEKVTPDVGREGLGLVVVEAQAAGLRSLLSQGIPEDAIVDSTLCSSLPLADGAKAWGARVRTMLAAPRPDRALALAAIESSDFALETGFRNLVALHRL